MLKEKQNVAVGIVMINNCVWFLLQVLKKFNDVVWHVSWSVTGNILAVSGGDNKVSAVL